MNIQWEAGKYTENFDFVHRYGESVLELVEAEAGGLVVDLGCGNGALTQKLADRGYRVLGVDDSAEMVAEARALHPDCPSKRGMRSPSSWRRRQTSFFLMLCSTGSTRAGSRPWPGNVAGPAEAGRAVYL